MELVGFANRTFCHNDNSNDKTSSGSSASSSKTRRRHESRGSPTPSFPASSAPIIDLAHRDFIDGAPPSSQRKASSSLSTALATKPSETHRVELTADFRRLNILLMRIDKNASSSRSATLGRGMTESTFMSLDYPRQEAHKVATLTLAEAKITASYGQESSNVEGSLGGLNLCDLTPTCGR